MGKPATKKRNSWWEAQKVASGHQLNCRIGTLALTIGRGKDEWTLSSSAVAEEEADARATFNTSKGSPDEVEERYVHSGDSGQVILAPRLADRSVVMRPRQPVSVLSGQTITLYLSTPIWLEIMVSDPPVLLREIPVLNLSDTWFGPSTREGELCYADRTRARHDPAELPDRAHRAITPLTIQNKATTPLALEKISLPVPMLALYGDEHGKLWTQKVTLIRQEHGELASIQIEGRVPGDDAARTRLAEPRVEFGRSGVTRAFNLLFGH